MGPGHAGDAEQGITPWKASADWYGKPHVETANCTLRLRGRLRFEIKSETHMCALRCTPMFHYIMSRSVHDAGAGTSCAKTKPMRAAQTAVVISARLLRSFQLAEPGESLSAR